MSDKLSIHLSKNRERTKTQFQVQAKKLNVSQPSWGGFELELCKQIKIKATKAHQLLFCQIDDYLHTMHKGKKN